MTSEWHEVPLRELVGYISKGIAPSYAEEASESTIRVLNQKCNRNFRISYGDSRLHDTRKKKVPPKDLSINKSKFVSHGENDITELGLRNSSASLMPEGTVLFSSRAPIGYIAIAAGEVTTNQGFKSVVPKPEIGTPFVYFFLKNTLPVIEGMASGSTFKEVSGSTMKNVSAVIPDAETLAKFSDFCAPIFAQQRILEEQNQSLATLRDNLLPKLMSGEIDVSAVQL